MKVNPLSTRHLRSGMLLVATLALFSDCFEDRPTCDEALQIVCGCSSRPCDRADPPEVVRKLRRCGDDDVRDDGCDSGYDGNLHMCINDSPSRYCSILDSLLGEGQAVCDLDCNEEGSCDLREQCLAFQWNKCGIVNPDGGTD